MHPFLLVVSNFWVHYSCPVFFILTRTNSIPLTSIVETKNVIFICKRGDPVSEKDPGMINSGDSRHLEQSCIIN